VEIKNIDFKNVMDRMRKHIFEDINMIREGLSDDENIDYYPEVAEFTAPYTLKVGSERPWDKIHLYCLTWPMRYNAIHNLKIPNSANIMCNILQSCFSNLAHIKSFP
jgi:hypothetical protein